MQDLETALRTAALLADAPLPLESLVPDVPAARKALADRDGVTVRADDEMVWKASIELAPDLRASLEPTEEARVKCVNGVGRHFVQYFAWPPPPMRINAARMEPHLDTVAAVAGELEQRWAQAMVVHTRALFVSWGGVELERALGYSDQAVAAYRGDADVHGGNLALFLTGLGYFREMTGDLDGAWAALSEAEPALVDTVGRESVEPYLLYCQMAKVARRREDEAEAARTGAAADAILPKLGEDAPRLKKLRDGALAWAHVHLQHYILG